MFNFRDISELFLKNKAALMAQDRGDLINKIKEILSNNILAGELAGRASELIVKNRGATMKSIQVIRQLHPELIRNCACVPLREGV